MIGLVASQLMGRSRAASARFQPQCSAMFLGASAASARCMAFKAVSPPITYIAGAITSPALVHLLDWDESVVRWGLRVVLPGQAPAWLC